MAYQAINILRKKTIFKRKSSYRQISLMSPGIPEDSESNSSLFSELDYNDPIRLNDTLIDSKRRRIALWVRKREKNDIVCSLLAISGLVLGIIQYEDNFADYAEKSRYESSGMGNILKFIIILLALYTVPLLYLHSTLTYRIDR